MQKADNYSILELTDTAVYLSEKEREEVYKRQAFKLCHFHWGRYDDYTQIHRPVYGIPVRCIGCGEKIYEKTLWGQRILCGTGFRDFNRTSGDV